MENTVTVRCRPWSTEGAARHRCLVETDGSVLVWDRIAGHFTRCHSLSARSQAHVRRLARAVRS